MTHIEKDEKFDAKDLVIFLSPTTSKKVSSCPLECLSSSSSTLQQWYVLIVVMIVCSNLDAVIEAFSHTPRQPCATFIVIMADRHHPPFGNDNPMDFSSMQAYSAYSNNMESPAPYDTMVEGAMPPADDDAGVAQDHDYSDDDDDVIDLENDENVRNIIRTTATQMDELLEDMKGHAKTLLEEVQHYVHEATKVSHQWSIAQKSEHEEAARIDAIEPNVQEMTIVHQQEEQRHADLFLQSKAPAASLKNDGNDE